jgi:hypothetical protein
MSGNQMLDAQIAQAVMPRFNPMQAMQQQQPRQDFSYQPVQNPFFGGSIPMNFGLPQVNQIPGRIPASPVPASSGSRSSTNVCF